MGRDRPLFMNFQSKFQLGTPILRPQSLEKRSGETACPSTGSDQSPRPPRRERSHHDFTRSAKLALEKTGRYFVFEENDATAERKEVNKDCRWSSTGPVYFTQSLRNGHLIVTKVLKDAPMDIDALHSALLSFTLLFGKVRFARERVASKGPGSDLRQCLNELERDLGIATATLAGELGFDVCRCCWPPEVLATDIEGHVRCLGPVEERSRSKRSDSARGFAAGARRSATPGVSKKRVNGSSPPSTVAARWDGRDRRSKRSTKRPGLVKHHLPWLVNQGGGTKKKLTR
jgi:hypothetical protein